MSGPGRPFHTLDKDLGRITHVETAQLYAFVDEVSVCIDMNRLIGGAVQRSVWRVTCDVWRVTCDV